MYLWAKAALKTPKGAAEGLEAPESPAGNDKTQDCALEAASFRSFPGNRTKGRAIRTKVQHFM